MKLAKRMIIGVNGHFQSISLIKRKYSNLLLAFVFLFINLQIYSQSKHVDPFNINVNYHYGFNLPEMNLCSEVSAEAFSRRLVIELAGANDDVLKFLPPLVIEEETLKKGLKIVDESIEAVLAKKELLITG